MTQAQRDLIEAIEALAEDRPLPRGMNRYDLLDLARAALADPPKEQVEAGIAWAMSGRVAK